MKEKHEELNSIKNKLIAVIAIIVLLSLALSVSADAVYQSRPGFSALVSTTADDFFEGIREMETSDRFNGIKCYA